MLVMYFRRYLAFSGANVGCVVRRYLMALSKVSKHGA